MSPTVVMDGFGIDSVKFGQQFLVFFELSAINRPTPLYARSFDSSPQFVSLFDVNFGLVFKLRIVCGIGTEFMVVNVILECPAQGFYILLQIKEVCINLWFDSNVQLNNLLFI